MSEDRDKALDELAEFSNEHGLTDVNVHVRVEVEWGVRKDGYVDWFGTKPGGTLGMYTEDEARYLARNGRDRELVRRTKRVTIVTSEWQAVE